MADVCGEKKTKEENCTDIKNCCKLWHSRLPVSAITAVAERVSEKHTSPMKSYNHQLDDTIDTSVQHSGDLIVTSPIQVSTLLHTVRTVVFIHRSTLTIMNWVETHTEMYNWENSHKLLSFTRHDFCMIHTRGGTERLIKQDSTVLLLHYMATRRQEWAVREVRKVAWKHARTQCDAIMDI